MKVLALVVFVLLLVGCAAGEGSQWREEGADPAGFFAGLWHGILLFFALIISFFADTVSIYESVNSGVGYNIGFVIGVLAVYGSGTHVTVSRGRKKPRRSVEKNIECLLSEDEEWEEIGEKLKTKLKAKLRRWLDEDE